MSNILRSALKYSITNFGINSWKLHGGNFISRSSACINHLQNKQFQTTSFNCNFSIDQFIKKLDYDARRIGRISLREVEDAFHEIKQSRSASATQSLMVIRCCGNLISEELPEKRTQLVQEIWNTFEKLGITLDISHYNALLRVYLENEHPFVPTKFLSELEQKGIEPNRVTYQRLITRYCQTGDIDGATRILKFMQEKEMPINEIVFNALILGHSQANDMESAEGILTLMRQAGIHPSPETYTILICGYIKQGNLDKVRSLLQKYEDEDVAFIDKDYLEMIFHLTLHNHDINEVLSKVKKNYGYNQEAVNLIYKLIAVEKTETAFRILKTLVRNTRIDGSNVPTGRFFIAALVRKNIPVEEIIKYSDELMRENLDPYALFVATENCLRFKKEEAALKLLRAAKERDLPIRSHYFWPLLAARGKAGDSAGIFKILNTISTEFNMPIVTETVRDFVIPFVLKEDTNISSLLFDLKSCGVSIAASVCSVVQRLLHAGKFQKAAEIASSYKAFYAVSIFRKPLVYSYLKTGDAESFTTLLKQIAAGIQWRAANLELADKGEEEDEIPEYRETVGQIVNDLIKQMKSDPDLATKVEQILKLMLEKGVGLSGRSAEIIQQNLQDKLTPEISSLLENLINEDVQLPEQRSTNVRSSGELVNVESMERLYESMKAKGESSKAMQKQLFTVYGRTHQCDKLLKLKEELEAENFVLTTGMKAFVIEALVELEKVDEAWDTYKSYREKEPDLVLHSTKILQLAALLVKNERYDQALELLKEKAQHNNANTATENQSFTDSSLCWRILNHFAEKGDVEKLNHIFDLIIKNEYCTVNNILLGPLIKVHMIKGDMAAAVSEFENCCLKYRATPWKSELVKKCIENDDPNTLQRITDLSTQIHGESNSLYDLMLAFLECGRIRQAQKILETPGLRMRPDRLQNAGQKYQNSGATEHLENLLVLTKNINGVDRSDLYYNLLLAYDKAGEAQKAMSLWLQQQEEDEVPTDAFLILLADVLKRNDIPVPFNVPELSSKPSRVQQSESRVQMSPISKEFRSILKNGNVDEALKFKNSKKPQQFNNTDLSLLMEALVSHGRFVESKEVLKELLNRNVAPMTRILKYFTITASVKGDIESFKLLDEKLTETQKRMTLFSTRQCRAYLNAGKIEEYLSDVESQLDSANTKEEMLTFLRIFPRGALLNVLKERSDLLPRVQRIADKCLERDSLYLTPLNVIWMYHMLNKNFPEADKLWKNYFVNSQHQIGFKGVCNTAERAKDLEILTKLQNALEQKQSTTPRTIGIVYGAIIKVLVSTNQVEKAVKFLDESVQKIPLDAIMKDALETLKAACAAKDISFKYTIPQFQKNRKRNEELESDSD